MFETLNIWKSVIAKFKNRHDVQNGNGIGWKYDGVHTREEDIPFNIGDGLGTTGWCVSASETLLNDEYFQLVLNMRSATARLISIDIKEQYWGYTYSGHQNKWHTAILVDDGGYLFIIDITCRQFGNDFVDKDIWDLQTWLKKLRSPLCKHYIHEIGESASNNPLPIETEKVTKYDETLVYHKLKDNTLIDDKQRNYIVDFVKNYDYYNKKLITTTFSKSDFDRFNDINEVFSHFYHTDKLSKSYAVLRFDNKESCKNWLEVFLTQNCQLPQYVYISSTIEEACKASNVKFDNLYLKYKLDVPDSDTYLVLEFNNQSFIDFPYVDNVVGLAYYYQKFKIKNNSIQQFNNGEEGIKSNTVICKLF